MDPRLLQLLEAERQVRPDPGAEERIWAAVEHRLTHGPPPPSGAEVAPGAVGGAASTGIGLKIVAGLALIAAVGGGAIAASGSGRHAGGPAAVAARDVPKDMSDVPGGPDAPPEPAIAADPASAPMPEAPPAPEVVPAPEVPPAPAPEATKRKPRARPKPGDQETPARELGPEDFAAELQLIAAIRGALKRGDSAAALARIDEHVRRFGARGQLVQERMAYHVEALCAAGRVGEARKIAADLLARWPDSTHAPRIRTSCAGA